MSAGAVLVPDADDAAPSAVSGSVLLVEITDHGIRWARTGAGAATGGPAVSSAAGGTDLALGPAGEGSDRDATASDWRRALAAGPRPQRIVVANAAGGSAAAALRDCVASAWGIEPEFLTPRAHAAGLTCPESHLVGVDRWLAMVGASGRARGTPFVVVTCGAALAIDLVDGGGRHRGGYVVPGIGPMRDALFARTGSLAALAALQPPAVEGLYGVNTAGAIAQGSRIALASLAERARRELAALQRSTPRGYVAGDDCDELRQELAADFQPMPGLILEGLALVATEAPR